MPGAPERRAARLPPSAQAVLEASPDAVVVVDATMRVVSLNAAAGDLAGVDVDLLAGRSICAVIPSADAWAMQRHAATALAQAEPVTATHRVRRPDGQDTWLETRLRRLPPHPGAASLLVAVCRDVSARVAADEQLAALAGTWDDVWQALAEGVLVIDRQGLIVTANRAAAEFLGLARHELHGSLARTHVVVIDENGAVMPAERLPSSRAFRTGVTHEESLAYRRRDGSVVWLRARAVPLWRPGAVEPDRVAIMLEDAVGPAMDGLGHRRHTGRLAEATRQVLTPRELEVLRLLAGGDDVRGVASTLGISIHTARGHVKALMRKLDARTQLQAVVIALRSELLELP